MKMPYLPSDLVEEILSRVPAISLKRLQSTCKRWNALFQDQRFTEKHLRKASKESLPLMLKEFRVYSMNIKLNVGPPSLEFKGPLDMKDSHSNSQQVDIDNVFHCDGLLLCTTKNYRLVVWNPCLGETRWIQPKTSYDITSKFALGYENNKSCHSYKILRSYHRGAKRLSVLRQEQLSVLDHNLDGSDMEIWLSSRIGSKAALLWTKSFTVDLLFRNIHLDPVSFFVNEEEKVVVCSKDWYGEDRKKVYIIGEDNTRHTEFSFVDSRCTFIFSYVPSLVQIQ